MNDVKIVFTDLDSTLTITEGKMKVVDIVAKLTSISLMHKVLKTIL